MRQYGWIGLCNLATVRYLGDEIRVSDNGANKEPVVRHLYALSNLLQTPKQSDIRHFITVFEI